MVGFHEEPTKIRHLCFGRRKPIRTHVRIAPISDRFRSLCPRVFSRAAAILKSEKTLGTRLSLQFSEALYTITLHNPSVYTYTRKPPIVIFTTVNPILAVPNTQLLTRRYLQRWLDIRENKLWRICVVSRNHEHMLLALWKQNIQSDESVVKVEMLSPPHPQNDHLSSLGVLQLTVPDT